MHLRAATSSSNAIIKCDWMGWEYYAYAALEAHHTRHEFIAF